MDKVLYSKYNQSRNATFQTKTVIYEGENGRYVTKSALGTPSKTHVTSFPEKYEMTCRIYPQLAVLPCRMEQETIYYEFIDGQALDTQLQPYLKDVEKCILKIKVLFDKYYHIAEECQCAFTMTEEYRDFFGEIDCSQEACVRPVNLDMVFDNLYELSDGSVMVFDYEWTYDMALPQKFVLYRVLSRFYDKYFEVLSAQMDFEDFVEQFDIPFHLQKKYQKMEQTFISHIYRGGEQVVVSERHLSIRNDRDTIENALERASEYEALGQIRLENDRLRFEMGQMVNSRSWKVTKPLRLCKKTIKYLKNDGFKATCQIVGKKLWGNKQTYGQQVTKNELSKQKKENFLYKPLISVITPLFNTPERFLRDLIESLQAQTYANWQWCVVDFSDPENHLVEEICREYAKDDERIVYERDYENRGISENTNRCLLLAKGDYIAMVDHDDIVHPAAFYEVVKVINDEKSDFIYTDEIKFQNDLHHVYAPNYKPEFSAIELRVHNYICHLNVYKRSLLDKVGLYRKECDGSQDHDMVLRLTEVAEHISHIPQILYYWRVHANSVAVAIEAKPYATLAGIRSVNAQYARLGLPYQVESIRNNIPCYRTIPVEQEYTRRLRIVIWGSNDVDEILTTWNSVRNNCTRVYALSIIQADLEDISERLRSVLSEVSCQVYQNKGIEIENDVLQQVICHNTEEYFWFIKAGMQLQTPQALSEMMVFASQTDVAAVDVKIMYDDGRVFSGGVISSNSLVPQVQFRCQGNDPKDEGYETALIHARNVSAVSGLCTLVVKKDWMEIPQRKSAGRNPFIIHSLNANGAGKQCVWTAHVVADGNLEDYREMFAMEEYKAEEYLPWDPYYPDSIRKYKMEA